MKYELTKEADALLCILYANYKQKNKTMPRDKARKCGHLSDIIKLVGSEFNEEDTKDLCYELKHNELMWIGDADDTIFMSELTTKAIAYMQNRSGNEIKQIVKSVFSTVPQVFIILGM